MQQPQPVCIKCGQEHTAPCKSTDSASVVNCTSPAEIDMTRKFIMMMICKLSGLCMINNWCIDKATLFKEEVELLSSFAHWQGLHELFPAKDDKVCNIKKIITQLDWACEKLKDGEETTIKDILKRQILALKIIECKVYSVADGAVNDTEPEDAIEQEDHEEDNNKDILLTTKNAEHSTGSTQTNPQIKIKSEENGATEIVDYQPNVLGNAITTAVPDDTHTDVTKSSLPSAPPTPVAASSIPLQAVPAAMSVSTPVFTASVGNGKRKGASEPIGSSPVKHRRTQGAVHQPVTESVPSGHLVDKTTMLRQVTCLNISLESFTDMSLRQVESDRKHYEQELAFEKHKQAYEESKHIFEERKRAYEESMRVLEEKKQLFEDNERICGESNPIYAATQECLATRAESVGENIIEEANNLLSSIEERQTLQDIVPAFQRLRTIFGDFVHAQGELSEEHRFKGDRARILYMLMERIHKAVGIEVPVGGTRRDGPSRCHEREI